jgi:catechol 2,3-dioxygenase
MTPNDAHLEVQSDSSVPALHAATRLGPLSLRVADGERAVSFYERVIGLSVLGREDGDLVLGAQGGVPLVKLKTVTGARHIPRASGLYHFALLLPSRADLGSALRRLVDTGIRFGEADHRVSEALYLSDLDGNGIELYRDRPRAEWRWDGGRVAMTVDPLDLDALLADAGADARGASAETRMGHIHLQVSEVAQAVDFYHGVLGFSVTAALQGAAFLSAGGYHHHIGLNSWETVGAPPVPRGAAGLESFTVEVPDEQELARIAERLKAAHIPALEESGRIAFRDPWDIGVDVVTGGAAQ